jgi:hypothetical protein
MARMQPGTPLGWHVMLRLADDRVIAPDPAALRGISACILRHGRRTGLLAFRVVDTHVHLVITGTRSDATALARAVELGARARLRLAVGWNSARFVAVVDQHRLERAFHYVLRNEAHHGVRLDTFHDGSAVVDLLGLRTTGVYLAERVRRALPRVTRQQLLDHLGTPALVVGDVVDLADAAAAAFALPDLAATRTAAPRHAAVAAAGAVRSTPSLAAELGVSLRTVSGCAPGTRTPCTSPP